MPYHPNGAGESLGDILCTTTNLYTGTSILYVHHTGSDANAGTSKEAPKATVAGANSATVTGSMIMLLDGHTETIASTVTVANNAVVIVGAGQSSGKPTVKLTNNQAAAAMIVMSGTGCELRNVWLEEDAQANSVQRVTMSGLFGRMSGCYVESNGNSDALDVVISAAYCRVMSNTFISTSTTVATRPVGAISCTSGTYIEIGDNVFDGGTVGYSDYAVKLITAIAGLKGSGNSFLRGADFTKPVVGADDGYFAAPTVSGASVIEGW